jgi:two-component system response regulator NreC
MLLNAEPDFQVVGDAGSGVGALELVKDLFPDILLLDIGMPGMSGLEVIGKALEVSPETRVLILTMHDDEGYLHEALAAGAAGYVLKRAADTELTNAIRAVHQGGTYLHSEHMKVLLEVRSTQRDQAEPLSEPKPSLSRRERQVLKLIALGYTNKQAADELELSIKTVETYRARLMSKLELQSRAELVRYAMQKGMLDDESVSE